MNRDVQTISSDKIAAIRREYEKSGLSESVVAANPFEQFSSWFVEAATAALREPNAMTLATVDERGAPDARIVLLKGLDADGLVFYTNYESAKGRQLERDPRASIVLFWCELERQVRVKGRVAKVSSATSEAYFRTRPRESQIGAWASAQSGLVDGREHIERHFEAMRAKFPDEVPLPPHWGGYCLIPHEFEFWQGRRNRLHDRIRYRLVNGKWIIERLAP